MNKLNSAIEHLLEVGLIKDTGEGYELTHDILAEKISGKITDAERERLVAEAKIHSRYKEYEEADRDKKFYLDGGDLSLIKGDLGILRIDENEREYVKKSKRRYKNFRLFRRGSFVAICLLAVGMGVAIWWIMETTVDIQELNDANEELNDANKKKDKAFDDLALTAKELQETISRKEQIQAELDQRNQILKKKNTAFLLHSHGENYSSLYSYQGYDVRKEELRQEFTDHIKQGYDDQKSKKTFDLPSREARNDEPQIYIIDSLYRKKLSNSIFSPSTSFITNLSLLNSQTNSPQEIGPNANYYSLLQQLGPASGEVPTENSQPTKNENRGIDSLKIVEDQKGKDFLDSAKIQFNEALKYHPDLFLAKKELMAIHIQLENYGIAQEIYFESIKKNSEYVYFYKDILRVSNLDSLKDNNEDLLQCYLNILRETAVISDLSDVTLFNLGFDFWWKIFKSKRYKVSARWESDFLKEIVHIFKRIESPTNYQIETIVEVFAISDKHDYYKEFLDRVNPEEKKAAIIIYLLATEIPLEEKKSYLDKAYELEPQFNLTLSKLADYHLREGHCDSAIFYLHSILELNMEELMYDTYHDLGMAYEDCDKSQLSLANYLKASQISRNSDILEHLGSAYYSMQRYDSAMYYFDEVLRVDPENITALHRKGDILESQNKFLEAADVFLELIAIDTDIHYVLDHYLDDVLAAKDTASAWLVFNFFIDPENSPDEERILYLNSYAWNLTLYGVRLDDALKYSLESISLAPSTNFDNMANLWDTLAEVYFDRNELIKANQANRKAKQLAITKGDTDLLEFINDREMKIKSITNNN